MKLPTLFERVERAAHLAGIIIDEREGLTQLAPSVMIFHGVKRDYLLSEHGIGRQLRYLALIGETITIKDYEN